MKKKIKFVISKIRVWTHGRKLLKQLLMLLLAAIIGFIIGIFVCIAKPWENVKEEAPPSDITADNTVAEEKYFLTTTNVQQILEPASDLITAKYYYTDVGTYENYKELFGRKIPFTTEKVVFTYDGVISIGIDLAEVKYQIDNKNQIITIILPELSIISNEINETSFEFPYMSNSIFNETKMDDYVKVIGTLKQEETDELVENTEFMNDVLANTRQVIKNFLSGADITKDYRVIFKRQCEK